jgi:hypothetical protein
VEVDADARFAAGLGGVARYFADSSGLESETADHLETAVVAACQEVFEHLTKDHPLSVTFTRHADRLEVALSYEGGAEPAVGLDTIAGGASVLESFDRLQFEKQGSRATTRLTKYVPQTAPRR